MYSKICIHICHSPYLIKLLNIPINMFIIKVRDLGSNSCSEGVCVCARARGCVCVRVHVRMRVSVRFSYFLKPLLRPGQPPSSVI